MGNTEAQNHAITHRWLNTMDTFSLGIYGLDPFKRLSPEVPGSPHLPSELQKDVTVALIDDGVNILHKAIGSRIENGISFESGQERPDQIGRFEWSTTGHGTFMAYMIGRICPRVKIYVCKLHVSLDGSGTNVNFTAESAANVGRSPIRGDIWLNIPGRRVRGQPRLRYHFDVVDDTQ